MTKLSHQLSESSPHESQELNGIIESNPIYVTSVPELSNSQTALNSRDLSHTSVTSPEQTPPPSGGGKAEPGPGADQTQDAGESPEKEQWINDPEKPLPNGHSFDELDSKGEEIELTQEIVDSGQKGNFVFPVPNGRNEVLLGKETDGRGRGLSENKKKSGSKESISSRKSGSSGKSDSVENLQEGSPRKENVLGFSNRREVSGDIGTEGGRGAAKNLSSSTVRDNQLTDFNSECSNYAKMISMVEFENGPHREMAVDVPETFVARTKTPPRYPPPKSGASTNPLQNSTKRNSAVTPQNGTLTKPIPPPRDHLKIEKDGRLVNKATPPQLPARTMLTERNQKKPILQQQQGPSPAKTSTTVQEADSSSNKEQLERIKKYQEEIRKRKEQEEQLAREEEFLRSSLRGSKKLQALEDNPPKEPPVGIVNAAFALEDEEGSRKPQADDGYKKIVGITDLIASLQRIQNHLQKNGHSCDGELNIVQSLLHNTDFRRVLAVHNKVQQIWCFNRPPTPIRSDAQDLVQECLNSLHISTVPEAAELVDVLNKFELEGLIYAHDKIAEREDLRMMTTDEELLNRANHYPEEDVKIVKIEKTSEPLGATVRNDDEAVIIGRIVKGGAAERSGLLHEGDEILEVNATGMRGKSVNDVCDILSRMTGTLTFLIVPAVTAKAIQPTRENFMHVKAHFDYDPEDDLYIPCRELGISFQKGDILHVISQEDPNWWQAYREGEEDQALAGLIPSRSFQQQREAMKQTIVGDTNKEKSKKSKFLCAKKNQKKKKKKVPYNATFNEGKKEVMYSATFIEEYDAEEILTYEEVALYYPRANHKRPIVLIGPPNIGRHELRQKLMEDSDRFTAAVPHTSRMKRDGELDGQDYHFITRVQFEGDILNRKFVEHGEYEKAYYGTSLNAIRTVVNSGKICVLNLHPQSLKILKNSDLKPYVVFVAPPSLEKLRQRKIRMGESFKDEELKDIIKKARDMEDSYGHYFDMIIIYNDTERAYQQLLNEINILEREPQWVPGIWLKNEKA